MNTQREVFNKLFKEEKTELATQKIELGTKDVANLRRDASKAHNDAMKKINKARSEIKSEITSGLQKVVSFEKEVKAIIKRNEKLGKEIGIDIASTTVGKNLIKAENEIGDLLKSLKRKYDEIF